MLDGNSLQLFDVCGIVCTLLQSLSSWLSRNPGRMWGLGFRHTLWALGGGHSLFVLDFFGGLQRIPCAFVKQHGHSFKDRAMLEGANGQRWPVGIGGAFDFKGFMEGWRPFAAYHCLVKGDQLVFTLVGHSQFAVQGFDKNGCSKKGTAIVCTICSRRNALTAPANRSVVGKLKCTISKRYEKVEKKAADTVVMMVNKQQCSSAIPKLEIPREQQVKSEHHVVNDLGSIKTQESLGCIPKPASPRRQRRQQRCSPTGKLPPSSPPSPAAVKTTNPSFKIMMKKTHVAQPFYVVSSPLLQFTSQKIISQDLLLSL